ncbi:hypothetical protein WOLCODRAFT_141327 [Wolfiporia cocos MD-104 SS10]|uniref:Uncharacterized protein n=1 Tax=Wolfiporia cocos (strain MD-104) TaxID=742152 RepID=A0A2H3JSH7_WOLCO|nr:hypothetical protein WOLCODRAFT_141327 [Wolfiporia cocos MD-104 SS10]
MGVRGTLVTHRPSWFKSSPPSSSAASLASPSTTTLVEEKSNARMRLDDVVMHRAGAIDTDRQSIDIHSSGTGGSSTRSPSRGRDFRSSGRGGIGNIRRTSQDPGAPAASANAAARGDRVRDMSTVRGRERPTIDSERIRSTGRGGVGNIHSSSVVRTDANSRAASTLRDRAVEEEEYERAVLRAREEEMRAAKHSSGRGGAGNISRTKSTSATR